MWYIHVITYDNYDQIYYISDVLLVIIVRDSIEVVKIMCHFLNFKGTFGVR